ncbi:hypothetical protein SAMN04488483_2761 [Pseudomonas helmanticensis]|uniref:Uncharacterized protein n=1 Tax=Pseudomonas helmanticensis TaxID=1471381 RepID=A0ACD2U5Z3_9PSED|nr:hypothetical protein [Pseudomonas helmanticensis]SMQ26112.1 hypothetical protein SAMN04488483_2761 [Pseudomonas helmanticensis]
MTYQLTPCGVLRIEDSAFIPQDPTNRDWVAYQSWLVSGGQVLPLDEAPEAAAGSTLKTLANKWLAGIGRQP